MRPFIRTRRVVVGLSAAACAGIGIVSIAAPSATGAHATAIGCPSNLPVVAYDGTGAVLAAQAGAPQACQLATGFATQETHIVVTRSGVVVQEPAVVTDGAAGTGFVPGAPGPHPWQPTSPAGIAVLDTKAAHPSFIGELPGGSYWTGSDAALYTDPDTGRLFEETLSPGNIPNGALAPQDQTPGGHATLLARSDRQSDWTYTTLTGFLYQENARYTSAPNIHAAPGAYPKVTYWCGNRDIGILEPLVLERECYRSFDGGGSWEMASILATSPVPQHKECGTNRDDLNSLDGNYPQGASDGSLYVLVTCTAPSSPTGFDGFAYIAQSTDQASTFPILQDKSGLVMPPIPTGTGRPELRVADVPGTGRVLELAYQLGTTIQLETAVLPADLSTATLKWSAPKQLTPTGLVAIDRWAIASKGDEVAVSYLAETRNDGKRDGYISVTHTPLAEPTSMVIWTGIVNGTVAMADTSAVAAKDDYIDVAIGPDGRPWASFFSPCSAEATTLAQHDSACSGAYVSGDDQPINGGIEGGNDRGIVGSLLFDTAHH